MLMGPLVVLSFLAKLGRDNRLDEGLSGRALVVSAGLTTSYDVVG
jgi:hypothetical protein